MTGTSIALLIHFLAGFNSSKIAAFPPASRQALLSPEDSSHLLACPWRRSCLWRDACYQLQFTALQLVDRQDG